ncbi:MAG TPA: hypothetical protein VK186_17235, partial [Candidatus Deferrimicrobium sp.]|nr:hypothetical protein [Candidatus Deferrimicrobium sp.]
MKTFNNIKKLNVFIVLVLVVLLAGIATTIYANEDTKQGEDEAKKEKEIKLEPGEEGKEYCKKIHDPKSQENINWKIQESEKLNLPEGLQLIDNKILCGTPTKVGVFIFTLNGMKSDNKNVTYKISLKIRPKINFSQSENLRFITGFEISRASCTSGGEKGFVDLYFSQPLPFSFNKERGKLNLHPFGVWGNIRFSSIPQQNTKNIGTEHS